MNTEEAIKVLSKLSKEFSTSTGTTKYEQALVVAIDCLMAKRKEEDVLLQQL